MASRGRRPEHSGPPELFYDKNEARKYVRNSRMIDVQTKMAGRALELLHLPEDQPCYLLDIGCGSGLSGDYLSDEGHYWVGIDISPAMLDAALDRDTSGDLLLGDMGQGIPFKPGSFDGCISSRMIDVQTKMAGRALELLHLPEDQPCYLLDIGCGSGLSGDYLSDEGHYWVGIDISPAMLDAALDRDTSGDLLLGDMGQGIPFKPGSFDGCISISAVQWLCNANKKSDIPAKRLYCFFSSLYAVLVRGARAVLQLYPENSEQLELITTQATKAGFTGGVVVDYPNSAKAKKFYLCLFSGPSAFLPKGLSEDNEEEEPRESTFTAERVPFRMARRGVVRKSREWVLEKKERRRRQGKEVRPDTQYTGRRRKPRF